MKSKFYIEQLAEFYSGCDTNKISDTVISKAKLTLLDYLFVLNAGYNKGVLTKPILEYVKNTRSNKDTTILFSGLRANLELTAFASGVFSHSVELDDGHRYGTAHPGVVVIPSALTVGEKLNATIGEVLSAIIIGYDVMLRLSRSINPSHLKRGFHSTSTTGTLGAAAAASVLFKFNSTQMTHALAISGLFSSGLQEMLHSNPSSKALQVGRSSQSGLLAAKCVKHNMKGPLSLLEGQHGWLKAMTDDFREEDLIRDLGERWEIMNTYTKLYPTCRHCHHAIDLAIAVYEMGVRMDEIKKVTIKTYALGIHEVGIIRNPKDIEEAMFSVAYSVAVALKCGFFNLINSEKYIGDKEINIFSSQIVIEEDEEMNRIYPQKRGCVLEVDLEKGEQIRLKTDLPKGEPENPLTMNDYLTKFKNITSEYLEESHIEKVFHFVMNQDVRNTKIKELIYLMESEI